ncbi:radical SAM protein [Marinitoga sp. 1138]|uniref:radical SAM protein n=1 Tax=Marinitoga sp. 1138 TaxID=1643334 RepID=UPI0015866E4B|nr:radical SAM protein [Marinitoga sp. 1138]NUU96929.1 hypothetical protein [Marinitoga sp. 1138]
MEDKLNNNNNNNNKIIKQKSIIWNLTKYCVWNCQFCCVDAKCIRPFSLINKEEKPDFSYDTEELNFKQKIAVIDQLSKGNYRIDFSGGELLIDPMNIKVIQYASKKLGKENIGISVSGAFITDEIVKILKNTVHDVEITVDYLPFKPYNLRPIGYHEYAEYAIKKLKKQGIRVGVQTVLTNANISLKKIYSLYNWIQENNVDEWSILRFFPSGRGQFYEFLTPTHVQYCEIVDYIKNISKNGKVEIKFQYLLPNHEAYTLECRAVKRSIGILPNGTVIACFWALDKNMVPNNDKYILGKVPDEYIEDILKNEKAMEWRNKTHMCNIFTKEILENYKPRKYII